MKRLMDLMLSGLALIILAVPLLIFALIVKLDSKGPVLFWQKRVGLHKETFMMPKFRSMYTETPSDMPTHLLADPSRWITPVGKVYRKLSIDELPQLWSIFTGKMSIIGPRPLTVRNYNFYSDAQKQAIEQLTPGLSGIGSVIFRDEERSVEDTLKLVEKSFKLT
jgi:O-antigen biosynthesis protein WbqP